MRPKVLGARAAIDAANPPFLIALEVSPYVLGLPVFAPSREDAARLVRELADAAGVEKQAWRSYVCERQTGAWERLAVGLIEGTVTTHHTEL